MATVTISDNDFTAYANIAQADTVLLGSLDFEAWDANDDEAKSRFLIASARLLDTQDWKTEYGTFAEREPVADIVTASILLANEIANGNTAVLGLSAAEAETKSLKAGSVEISYFRNFHSAAYSGSTKTVFPPAIYALLKPYLASASIGGFSVAYGTDGTSDIYDDYGVI